MLLTISTTHRSATDLGYLLHKHPDRLFNIQDYVSQVGQGAIPDRSQWHQGAEDVTVVMLRNLWQRELRNLAVGRPTKRWQRPAHISVGVARA